MGAAFPAAGTEAGQKKVGWAKEPLSFRFFRTFSFLFWMERGSVKRNWGRGKQIEIEILDFSEHFTITMREKIFRHEELLDRPKLKKRLQGIFFANICSSLKLKEIVTVSAR